MTPKFIATGIAIIAGLAYAFWPSPSADITTSSDTAGPAEVVAPSELSANAQIGKRVFEANCVACHGANGAGQDGKAPPLVHKIYEPSHHGDEAFQRAAAVGVISHHWRSGNMPAVEGITRADVTMIVTYIREVQRANGID